MVAADKQVVGNDCKAATQRELGEKPPVGAGVPAEELGRAQRRRAHHAVELEAPAVLGERVAKASTRTGVARVPRPVMVVADCPVTLVDDPYVAVAQNDFRVALEDLEAARQELGLDEVVVGRPLEVGAARMLEGQVEIAEGADVGRVAQVADAWIGTRVFAADRLGVIRGRVVDDDHLEVGERLT